MTCILFQSIGTFLTVARLINKKNIVKAIKQDLTLADIAAKLVAEEVK